jgi:membrane-associated phospholipid phosphatase
MAHHRETASANMVDQRGYALGQLLSRVFHPILLNMLMYLVVGYYGLANRASGLAWSGLCVLVSVLPPMLFYLVRKRRGAYTDGDISIRQQRNELYLVGFMWVLVATMALSALGLPRPHLAVMLTGLGLGLIGGVINLFWKISVHAASIAALATIVLLYSRELGIALGFCALAVGWARVRTGNHTPLQVLVGFVCAAATVLAAFQLVGASV